MAYRDHLIKEETVKGPLSTARRFYFSNGFGASVAFGPITYGFSEGLLELAVLKMTPTGWDLCYCTPVTDDVIGHLTEEEVVALLDYISGLR